MTQLKHGDKVRFTANMLGVLNPDDPSGRSFHPDHFVKEGDEGSYLGPHPSIEEWHMTQVEIDGTAYECPVHEGQIEKI